ncbi:hypothetical protein HCA78_11830 [Listeria booriae]|uniref:Uncharacterized protein n=1 Tax=Listeria booriae TaxID=1552123 RepID=A0A842D0R2_9LIST|nr:hypothetical protein [Listeria booriae]MBC1209456.1 hypothetical protein [Listeria booriae]MBC1229826.1 hypothetical protein [Listeria booriae]MBC1523547.1 hypothetical protein [Listeria booriae]MBC2004462.1 hypothetical protein [Listeria booriae]
MNWETILTFAGVIATAVYAYKSTAKTSNVSMESVYVKEMVSIVDEYKEQAEKLKEEVRILTEEISLLREENRLLREKE